MKQIALSEIKDNLPRFLREAASEHIVITRHGHPAGILVGFASEDDWFDYRLEHDSRFLKRIAGARASIRAGRGVALEDLKGVLNETESLKRGRRRTASAVLPPVADQPLHSQRTGKRRARSARRSSP